MGKLLTRVKQGVVGAPGEGPITLGDPIRDDQDGDHLTIAEAGGVDGDVLSYFLLDGGHFAEGEAAYDADTNSLGRDANEKRWNGSTFVAGKLDLTADAVVMLAPRVSDLSREWAAIENKPASFPPSGHQHDAGDITSGTLDVARIPVLPSMLQIVSSGGLANLTSPQQADIGRGTVVTTTDGRRFVYTGTGSKTVEASYIVLADITPEWTAIANKPTMTAAGLALLDDLSSVQQRATLDISASNTPFAPAGSIVATNVQAAIEEVSTEAGDVKLLASDEVLIGSPVPSIDINALMSNLYAFYELRFTGLTSTSASALLLNVSSQTTFSTPKSLSGPRYCFATCSTSPDAGAFAVGAATSPDWPLTMVSAGTALDEGVQGSIKIWRHTSGSPLLRIQVNTAAITGVSVATADGWLYAYSSGAINSLRIKFASGNVSRAQWSFWGHKS